MSDVKKFYERIAHIPQLTKEQAIEFAKKESWKHMSNEQIAKFQLTQHKLCMPFDKFHHALEKTLDRPVFTHELAFPNHIYDELFNGTESPSIEEIMNLIPEEKRIVIGVI